MESKLNNQKQIKIVLVGPAAVGKTTFRHIFFDRDNPFDLLQKSLEPTHNIETNVYSFETLIAVHDLAGQQLDDWPWDG